jgi:hypothetical protein
MFVIRATTLEGVRNQICDWLAAEAINYLTQARLAVKIKTKAEYTLKANALAAAAKFIRDGRIEVK